MALLVRLTAPAIRDDLCDFLRVTVHEILSDAEFQELKGALGIQKKSVRARSIAPAGDHGQFSQDLHIHAVSPAAAKQESEAMRTANPEYPAASAIAAHLHIVCSLERGPDVEEDPPASEEYLDKAFEWLRQRRKELQVLVMAGQTFDREMFDPVTELPEAPKPFTSVRRMTLVKESDDPRPGTLVYEVNVSVLEKILPVSVYFRAKLSTGADAMEKLQQQASEIAALGVRRKLVTAE